MYLKKKRISARPNVGVIIQARMSSKRFPGKVMAKIKGRSMLEYVIRRSQKIKGIDKVIVAVPDTPQSEVMLKLIEMLDAENFCGSENNVLERYYHAAKYFKLDIIMRITADCPLINPVVCTQVLDLALWRKTDYCSNIHPTRTYPKGLDCEVFTFDTLECANIMADSASDLEHVTPWMQREEGLKTALVSQKEDRSADNWCVDYPVDIQRIEFIIDSLKGKKNV